MCLLCCVGLWWHGRFLQARWLNVPVAPKASTASAMFLGDDQLAYRSFALMLQNLGDMGGRTTPLKDYDLDHLADWFRLMNKLDAHSDYIPYLAAFYFGSVPEQYAGEKLRPIVAYLHDIGLSAEGQKWRWLAHAVHLARFQLHDMDYAYEMATELADLSKKILIKICRLGHCKCLGLF